MGCNYFIEGLQGAGKSTYVKYLSEKLRQENYHVFREGDYSPIELAWCAYLDENQYESVLEKYSKIRKEIREKTFKENDKYIVCYTRILTDEPDFHKYMEQYEIYNGNKSLEKYETIIYNRYRHWTGENEIFECSLLQNIVENDILFYEMSDDRILEFYKKLSTVLSDREYQIIYLVTEDIRKNIELVKKERCDENGNEIWFQLLMNYIENSPYGIRHHLKGEESLLKHLKHRQNLEQRILEEIFSEHVTYIQSKSW